MGRINVLDFEVANLIAAGEVVDRPASCVKELLENTIDAGSTSVTAEIKRGGVSFIRIADNGCGIEREDMPTAILRHATSKIRTASDLSGIATLGFRGEALAAIASVSRLRILSKTPDADYGAMLTAEGGEVVDFSESGCTDGTTIIVEDLFYNVPARRKFLKKDATEAVACSSVVEKIALSHPEIGVKFISDGEVKFMTSGNGKLIDAIYAVYGKDISKRSLKVDREENGIRVTGFISEPDMSRNNRSMENFFINGRYVKSRTAAAAVEQAYTSKARADRFPFCVINIEINPAVVDVNVHPAKLEVKFTNEKLIFDAIYYAVLSALEAEVLRPELTLGDTLGGQNVAPAHETKAPFHEAAPLLGGTAPKATDGGYRVDNYRGQAGYHTATERGLGGGQAQSKSYSSAFLPKDRPLPKTEQLRISADAYRTTPPPTEERDDTPLPPRQETPPPSPDGHKVSSEKQRSCDKQAPLASEKNATTQETIAALRDFTPTHRPTEEDGPTDRPMAATGTQTTDPPLAPPEYIILGEAYNCYVIVQLEDRILMIDKHAAHERILFDELCRKMRQAKRTGQMLLVPCDLSLLCAEGAAIEEYGDNIRAMGYDFTFRQNGVSRVTYSLTQIPEDLNLNEASALFSDLAARLSDLTATVESAAAEFFESRLWQSACKAAIKGGRLYDTAHLRWICDRLLVRPKDGGSVIRTCPHGRPVAFEIRKSSIERQFARTL